MSEPEPVNANRGRLTTPSTWRIVAGLIPTPLAIVLDNVFSADAAERLPFILLGHLLVGSYLLVWAVVAAFVNEHLVNPYVKHSAIAVPVGTVLVGVVAAFGSATPYAWATAFLVTSICRVHYLRTTGGMKSSISPRDSPPPT